MKMHSPHAHDDVELNLLLSGEMEYILNGRRLKIQPRQLFAFWAARPHEVVEAKNAELIYVTIPLTRFITWSRLNTLLKPLLHGQCFTGHDGLVPIDVAIRWPSDFNDPDGDSLAAELEIQATLIRLARSKTLEYTATGASTAVDKMRTAIAEGYASRLTVAKVADAAGLHPNHAMRVFKVATGSSIGEYTLSFRLAHAKRLLADTNLILPLVSIRSGFGSDRRFFDTFRQNVGLTPSEYRRSIQNPNG